MAYQSTFNSPDRDTNAFYRRTLHVLSDARIPFLGGGSHALLTYTGIARETKDFDLFLRRGDLVSLSGDWRGGIFSAYRVEGVNSGRGRR